MRQLPGLLLSNQTANETAQIVLKELDARIERIKTALNTGRYGDTSGGLQVRTGLANAGIHNRLLLFCVHIIQDLMEIVYSTAHSRCMVSSKACLRMCPNQGFENGRTS